MSQFLIISKREISASRTKAIIKTLDFIQRVKLDTVLWAPGRQVCRVWPLEGGMSAQLVGIELDQAISGTERFVARSPSAYLRTLFDDAAQHEFKVLDALASAPIPTPKVTWLSPPCENRYFVMEFLTGEATANPANSKEFVASMAKALANIHRTPISAPLQNLLPKTKPRFEPFREALNDELREPAIVDLLLEWGDHGDEMQGLRHGDFWPGNILWNNNAVSGIVDWENALLGPPLADLAISRLDIFWILGEQAMDEFTQLYLSENPLDPSLLAYWDLRAAIRPMGNLPEWPAPYSALHRPDIDYDYLKERLMCFADRAIFNAQQFLHQRNSD